MPRLKAGICQALSDDVVKALHAVNLRSVADFVAADLESTSKESGVPYKDLVAIRRVILAQFAAFPVSGLDLYEDVVSSVAILATGCRSLDDLLDGGIYTGEVTEIMGGSATGKTQFCMSFSLSIAMETEKNVLYVDTNGSFDIARWHEMMEARQLDEEAARATCERVRCQKVFDVFELLNTLHDVASQLSKQSDPFSSSLKLVIIDSLPAVILPILGGKQKHGQGLLQHVSHAVKSLATEFAVAILVVNNVVINNNVSQPSLGKVWAGVPNVRLEMCRSGNERRATLLKSGRHAVGNSAVFSVLDEGVR